MNKVKESDKIYIYVKANPFQRVKATVTHVSSSGVVYFRPVKNLHFKLYPDLTNTLEGHLWAGKIYSTADIDNLVFTGSFKDLLGIALIDTAISDDEESEKATFEASPTLRKVNVNLEAPTMLLVDLPEHENRYTTEEAGQQTHVVDNVKEYFKHFCDANTHRHMLISPQKKFNSMLTSTCEDAKKNVEELKEAVYTTHEVVNNNYIEQTVRTMVKAGLSPYQIAEEIQRQFYNAMVKE
ncbi:hypothetical protein CPT_Michonne102 [Citrobacter phage Michonne]|uniref:Uncharacterized protein n=1 Tax=Citrobacter phage Michonne TaxID=1675603 RepID=A0A0K1LN91_9CAUD|nr:hypothetical protein CPT_Michonne_gp127 [Citrobacter phage Michonne]AKU44051.1 hypothetical protein CPT_Michonne102 [Citrobacter phage Michonne]AYR00844.1 hypothetical protein CPT_Maleficent_125 [Citrobacter phage Maleficent]